MKRTNNIFSISVFLSYIIFIIVLLFTFCLDKAFSNESSNMKTTVKYVTESNGIKEYQLNNGIKVLLKPMHSIPLVTFSVWYKVGSRNETKGILGIAHFLEHMMFKGTQKYKKGEISALIQKHGGVFNAFTSTDGTTYYETISPKYLELVIEIESDRMKGSALEQKELDLERNVVLSELEGDLNNPATILDQKLRFNAYEKSPYKHPTIGYEEDIKNTDSKIMRDFYNKFYNPNNAAIVLAGDFNEGTALKLINNYFGKIKNENSYAAPYSIPRDEPQKKEKRFTVKRAGSFKILEVGYHITDAKHKDIYPLNIVEEILIKGEKSPLKKALIEKGLATDVYGGAEANVDPGLFYILVSLTPKASHKQVEKIITREIEKLVKNPPQEKEILAAKNRIKANYLFSQDGTYAKALNIGFFETINNWKQSIEWTEQISKATKEDVANILDCYFRKENKTIGYFIPKIRKGEKYESSPITLSTTHHYKNNNSTHLVTKNPTGIYTNHPLKFQKIKLKDGSDLLVYKNMDLPVTYITGIIKGGSSLLPKDSELYCQLISRLLQKGSKNYTKEQIEDILDSTGSHINFSCDEESFRFNIASLNENLEKTLDLFTDILFNPTFPDEEIKNEKAKLIAEIIELKDNTSEIARRKLTRIIYPKEHPYYSNNFEEDIKLVKKIERSKFFEIHKLLIKDNRAIIASVSNLNEKKLANFTKLLNGSFYNGKIKDAVKLNIPDTLLRDHPKTEVVFIKDKYQSDTYLGHACDITRKDPDFYKMLIANYVLGGSSLASRLNKKVRDNAGLVYTIYSYISSTHGRGEFAIYFGSNNKNVDEAIKLTKEELNNFVQNGITQEELKIAKQALVDSFVGRNLSTNNEITTTLATLGFYELGDNYINNYPSIINSLKLSDINSAIKKHIFPDKLNIVVAGEYKNHNK